MSNAHTQIFLFGAIIFKLNRILIFHVIRCWQTVFSFQTAITTSFLHLLISLFHKK